MRHLYSFSKWYIICGEVILETDPKTLAHDILQMQKAQCFQGLKRSREDTATNRELLFKKIHEGHGLQTIMECVAPVHFGNMPKLMDLLLKMQIHLEGSDEDIATWDAVLDMVQLAGGPRT